MNLKGRSLLSLADFSAEEIKYLINLAAELKTEKNLNKFPERLKHKQLALIFKKTSTRTRCAFEIAMKDEGGQVTFIDVNSSQIGKKESIEDTAKVLGRFFDAIEYRGFKQEVVEQLAKFSGVPVYNGLTDMDHPTQILADLLTIVQHCKKKLEDIKIVFCGDVRNNMAYAWMYACAILKINFVAYGPNKLCKKINKDVMKKVQNLAKKTGAKIIISSDEKSLKDADVIYTDIWASMGEEQQIPERVKLLSPFRITKNTLEKTRNPNVIFMHCLPAFHDFETDVAKRQKELGYDIREVSDDVFRSKNSVVFEEAENRVHSIKAVLVATLA